MGSVPVSLRPPLQAVAQAHGISGQRERHPAGPAAYGARASPRHPPAARGCWLRLLHGCPLGAPRAQAGRSNIRPSLPRREYNRPAALSRPAHPEPRPSWPACRNGCTGCLLLSH